MHLRSFALIAAFISSATSFAASSGCPQQGFVWDESAALGETRAKGAIAPSDGIRVLWWNILFNKLNHDLESKTGCASLDHNLEKIIQNENGPDVISFGEFSLKSMSPQVRALLESKYPYRLNLPYDSEDMGKADGKGVGFYSKLPITEHVRKPLDWVPPNMTVSEQDCYRQSWANRDTEESRRYVRQYDRIKLDFKGKPVYVVPFHAVQPWAAMNKTESTVSTVNEILFGSENPLSYQLQRLRDQLKKDFPAGSGAQALIIGDFNLPRRMPVVPSEYLKLTEFLKPASAGNAPTFPAKSAPERKDLRYKYLPIQIDHAFATPNLQTGRTIVLPLQGSDHYPIWVNISPSKK